MLQKGRLVIPLLLVAILMCGGGGFFCPMAASAAGTHHSQSDSHKLPATPFNSSGDCPDQFKSTEETYKNLTYGVFPITEFMGLADIVESAFSHYLFTSPVPQTSSYPLLFLLFSVFLN